MATTACLSLHVVKWKGKRILYFRLTSLFTHSLSLVHHLYTHREGLHVHKFHFLRVSCVSKNRIHLHPATASKFILFPANPEMEPMIHISTVISSFSTHSASVCTTASLLTSNCMKEDCTQGKVCFQIILLSLLLHNSTVKPVLSNNSFM